MVRAGAYRISFIIVNWNTRQLLIDCLKSVLETVRDLSYEIWVVDNGSSDGSVRATKDLFPSVKFIENDNNLGFAKANNQVLRVMSGEYAVLLNTDAILKDGAVKTIVEFMDKEPGVGICGGQLLNEDGSKQNSIANVPNLLTELTNKSLLRRFFPARYPGKEHHFTEPVEVETLVGACMVVRKKAIDKVGLLDEDYFFYLEETDWCLRFKKQGWKIVHYPGAEIYHRQGQSIKKVHIKGRIEYWKSRYIFFRKHRRRVARVALRAGLFIRICLNFLLLVLLNLAVYFSNKNSRQKLKLYASLIVWHLAGCPESWGLNPVK
jgi:GT2 family glycosyltransferase